MKLTGSNSVFHASAMSLDSSDRAGGMIEYRFKETQQASGAQHEEWTEQVPELWTTLLIIVVHWINYVE